MADNGFKISIGVKDEVTSSLGKMTSGLKRFNMEAKKSFVPLNKAGTEFRKFTDITGLRTFAGGVRSLTGDLVRMTGAGAAFTSLFGAGLVATVTAVSKQISLMNVNATSIGWTYQQLQRMQNVAYSSGVMDPSAVAGGVQSMNNAAYNALKNNDGNTEKFLSQLGLITNGENIQNFKNLTPAQIQKALLQLSSGSINGQKFNAQQIQDITNQIGGGAFEPLIFDGHTSQDFSSGNSMSVLDPQNVKNANALSVALGKLGGDFNNLTGDITGLLAPGITDWVNAMDAGVKWLNSAIDNKNGPKASRQNSVFTRNKSGNGLSNDQLYGSWLSHLLGLDTDTTESKIKSLKPQDDTTAPTFGLATSSGRGKFYFPIVDADQIDLGINSISPTLDMQAQRNMLSYQGNYTGSATPSKSMSSMAAQIKQATAFFMSKDGGGFTQAQAEGIVTNLWDESQLNPGARGDYVNGQPTAFGIGQWHMDRVMAILKATGIDVRTDTNPQDQLKALAWELNQSPTEKFAGDKIRQTTTAAQAAYADSIYGFRPGITDTDKLNDANKRANDSSAIQSIVEGFSTALANNKLEVHVRSDATVTATTKGPLMKKPIVKKALPSA